MLNTETWGLYPKVVKLQGLDAYWLVQEGVSFMQVYNYLRDRYGTQRSAGAFWPTYAEAVPQGYYDDQEAMFRDIGRLITMELVGGEANVEADAGGGW